MRIDFKPGDLIEWTYAHKDMLVNENENLWSTIEKRWVPIGSKFVHLCVTVDDETYSWLNEEGLHSIFISDENKVWTWNLGKTIPRARKL